MPIYEYECIKCKKIQEQLLTIKEVDTAEIMCDECGSQTKRLISNTTFQLNGVGWGKDGYISAMEKFNGAMKAVDNY